MSASSMVLILGVWSWARELSVRIVAQEQQQCQIEAQVDVNSLKLQAGSFHVSSSPETGGRFPWCAML